MKSNSAIYIAGPISGIEDYKERFERMEKRLAYPDQTVLNPAKILEGLEDEDCMPICLQLIEMADAVVLLPGWRESLGAYTEAFYALRQGKKVYACEDDKFLPVRWIRGENLVTMED